MTVGQLLKQYPLISNQVTTAELQVILRELIRTLQQGVTGDVVEFGCYIGTSSLFIRRVLDDLQESGAREFHVYDSFEGLPDKAAADRNAAGIDFKAGELLVSKKQFLREFQRARLQAPVVHKGWFDQLPASAIPEKIAFAFLDGDFYDSITASLGLVWPRIQDGGAVLIHDYKRETLPGVERAIGDFFRHHRYQTLQGEQNIAIIHV